MPTRDRQAEPEPAVEQVREEFTLFIPNVFSPNNDLTNDELRAWGPGWRTSGSGSTMPTTTNWCSPPTP